MREDRPAPDFPHIEGKVGYGSRDSYFLTSLMGMSEVPFEAEEGEPGAGRRYYAYPLDLAQIRFEIVQIETWVPDQHFEPASEWAQVAFKVAAMWLRVQHNFLEALDEEAMGKNPGYIDNLLAEKGQYGTWPIEDYSDIQDFDGTVFRLIYRIHADWKQVIGYSRRTPQEERKAIQGE